MAFIKIYTFFYAYVNQVQESFMKTEDKKKELNDIGKICKAIYENLMS